MNELVTITLAAGKGTRMKSKLPKVLHQVAGKSMVQHVVDTAGKLCPKQNIVIVGYKAEMVEEETNGNLSFIKQEEQLGTGHAVMQARDLLDGFNGTVLVLYGDTPLLTEETLRLLVDKHQQQKAAVTILTTKLDDPTGYGRIIRNSKGNVTNIVEEKDTTSKEAQVNEINTGICCFDSSLLLSTLDKLDTDNAQGEYYLTDIAGILAKEGRLVTAMLTESYEETIGVNTRVHLAKAEKSLRARICEKHMEQGITIIDPSSTFIDDQVKIGEDSIIYPFTFIEGKTKIGKEVEVGPRSRIIDSIIKDKANIDNSTVIESQIGENTLIGPYAYLRPGTKVGKEAKVGDFVEVKKSEIGAKSKVPHLSYIGDTVIGEGTNIGAGTITANYDGQNKYQTIIGDNVFIGSDSTLIAPIKVGNKATTGAGSVVTKDVKDDETVIGVPAKPMD